MEFAAIKVLRDVSALGYIKVHMKKSKLSGNFNFCVGSLLCFEKELKRHHLELAKPNLSSIFDVKTSSTFLEAKINKPPSKLTIPLQ